MLTSTSVLASSHWVDRDLWGHMAVGRETVRLGWPPLADAFSYMPTIRPLVYHEWLSGVAFYTMLMQLGGWSLEVAMLAMGLVTLGAAGVTARRLGASPAAIFVVTLVALPSFAIGYIPIRPQAFTFLLFAAVLWILVESDRGRPRLLLCLPPLFVVWANLHGGFVAGLGMILGFAVARAASGRRPWRLVAAGAVSLVVTLVNPYGFDYWRYLVRALTMPGPDIMEWLPAYVRPLEPLYWDAHTPAHDVLRVVFIGLVLVAVLTARARYWPGIVALAATGYLGTRHFEHLPLLAIAGVAFAPVHLTPLLDRTLDRLRQRLGRVRRFGSPIAVGVAGLYIAVVALDLAVLTSWEPIVPERGYPVDAVRFLKANGVHGNLATPFDWGQYVLWNLHPEVKVSFDGRYETAYPEAVVADNFNFARGEGDWRRLLTQYPTEMVLVARAHPVAPLMAGEPGWALAYEDPVSRIYLRADKIPRTVPPPTIGRGTAP